MAQSTCQTCSNKGHGNVSFAIPVSLPTRAAPFSPEERELRVWPNDELCVVDDQHFYIYGSFDLPVHSHTAPFIWGAWALVDEETFFRFQDRMEMKGARNESPSSLQSLAPTFPSTRARSEYLCRCISNQSASGRCTNWSM